MQSLQNQLVKYRNFVSEVRHTKLDQPQKDRKMQTQIGTRVTGGQGSNKRYKRTSEELDQDVAKVDELVASGKFNQIEALHNVGLQSSVYHYRKKQLKANPAKSFKPRKFAHRVRNKTEYLERKNEVLNNLSQDNQKKSLNKSQIELRLEEIQKKYETLKEYLTVEARYKELRKQVAESGILG